MTYQHRERICRGKSQVRSRNSSHFTPKRFWVLFWRMDALGTMKTCNKGFAKLNSYLKPWRSEPAQLDIDSEPLLHAQRVYYWLCTELWCLLEEKNRQSAEIVCITSAKAAYWAAGRCWAPLFLVKSSLTMATYISNFLVKSSLTMATYISNSCLSAINS